VDKYGVIYLTNNQDGRYNLVLKERWVPFQGAGDFESYDTVIWKAAVRYRVDYALVKAVIKTESNFNPQAVSRAGAKGLMQLMPGTANALGVDNSHPEDNIQGGVRHLRYLLDLFKGDMHLALAAYNAGEKVVFRYNGIPPYQETRAYIRRVLRYFQIYSSELRNPDSL
jgi:soluble lytic murein transglycosylase-like protein